MLVAALDGGPDPSVEVADRPSDEWWRLPAGRLPTAAQRGVLDPARGAPAGAPRIAFALLRDPDGTALGRVRAAVVDEHLHHSVLEILPAARRRGLATRLLAATAAWGRGHGARWGVLQVARRNGAARAFYDRLGFVEHHRYRYLVPPR